VDYCLVLFQRACTMVSRKEPTIAEILAKAQRGELRDLTATETGVLPNGQPHSYTIKTDSDSPEEIAAFEHLEAKKQAELAAVALRTGLPIENIDPANAAEES
jgi:hypothetical protein